MLDEMNEALAFEMRAVAMYSHYAAYVKGIHRIALSAYFSTEANESMQHAELVRAAIVKYGGIAVTERNSKPILHTEDYKEMLQQSLETEEEAAKIYRGLLDLVAEAGDDELVDTIESIYFTELRSVEEVRLLMS